MPRGGKRAGAGRKPSGREKKQLLSVRLSPHLIDRLKSEGKPGEVLEKILSEYFMKPDSESPNKESESEASRKIYNAIKSSPGAHNQVLISIRELRASLPDIGKPLFDSAIWGLVNQGKLFLHSHIHPIRLNEKERAQLLEDNRGRVYMGIVLRDTAK
jgi:hypothetical protein